MNGIKPFFLPWYQPKHNPPFFFVLLEAFLVSLLFFWILCLLWPRPSFLFSIPCRGLGLLFPFVILFGILSLVLCDFVRGFGLLALLSNNVIVGSFDSYHDYPGERQFLCSVH